MSIKVETNDVSVAAPAQIDLLNSSGANVEVFVFIGTSFSKRHAFDFDQSLVTFQTPKSLTGRQRAMVVVQATKSQLNRMYSLAVSINGEFVAIADGNLDDDKSEDSGSGLFFVTIGGEQ
jgi:hypothetical protein